MPTTPTATFIVIQAKFLLELLVILLDLPSGFGDLYQAAKAVTGGQIAEEIFCRFRGGDGPLHQQPDLFARFNLPLQLNDDQINEQPAMPSR